MAEIAVSLLLKKLVVLQEEEPRLLIVHGEIRNIGEEFQSIIPYLKEADAKVDIDDGVKVWVKQVRDVAFDMEDVLDEFILSHQELDDEDDVPGASGCKLFKALIRTIFIKRERIYYQIHNSFEMLDEDVTRSKQLDVVRLERQFGTQLKNIAERFKIISNRRGSYNLSNSHEQRSTSSTRVHDPRKDALFLEDYEVVGIDEPREKLTGYLLEADNRLRVVSVYGEGGLGKTTLVKKVYDSSKVNDRFVHKAWITVSETFDAKSVFMNLAEQLLGYEEAKRLLRFQGPEKVKLNEKLRGRRYLVVLDDIWTFDAWKELENVLPNDNKSRSRIIITTRFQNIANLCVQNYGHFYPLQRLNEEDSWKLFCKKAFRSEISPDQFRDISNQFLRKCNGLPLAIVAIGSLLFMKPHTQWDQVYQTLGLLMDGSKDSQLGLIHFVISLSYNDLPLHLKCCLLYLCIYPEDYSINCSKLFRLWVAEGFVERTLGMESMTAEDIAKSYLDELIQRSLIQRDKMDERQKVLTCKIHDLMRDFINAKSRDQNFATLIAQKQQESQSVLGKGTAGYPFPRRLSIYNLRDNDLSDSILSRKIGSLILLKYSWTGNVSRFRLLRVLDLVS